MTIQPTLTESLTKSGTTMAESQLYTRFTSLLRPEYEWQKEDLRQKTEISREDILRGVREKYSTILVARKNAESVRQEAARDKKSGGEQTFLADGSEKDGDQVGGRGKSRGGSVGGKKSNTKAADTKPSLKSATSSSITVATATTKCFKCQAEGHPHTPCPKGMDTVHRSALTWRRS